MRNWKRIATAVLTASMMVASAPVTRAKENKSFDEFLNDTFVEMMEEDYLSMHYTVRDYQSYGIEKPDLDLGDADWESFEEKAEEYDELLEKLHRYQRDSLTPQQQTDYDALEFYAEAFRDMNRYPMVSGYFEPGNGIHTKLLTMFTEFVFYEKQDFEDYLTVLSSVPEYIDEALEVTKRQAQSGYFMGDEALDKTLESIREFMAKKDDNQLIVIFEEAVAAAEYLNKDDAEALCKKNREIVLKQFIPSYEKAAKQLETLRGSRSFEGGMCNYPNGGKEGYEALAMYKTSSRDSIEAQLDLCTDYLMELINDYITLVMTDSSAEDQYEKETVDMKTPEEILKYLSSHLDDFPEPADVTYVASYLDPSVASDSTVAYYVTPVLDDYKHNVIRINGSNVSDENDLYETLAHEGFPGHLYQITYYLSTEPSPLRTAIEALGYSEGWAMYCELVAWDNSGLSQSAAELHNIYTALSYVEDAAVDLGVNGLGWTIEDVEEYLDSIGLNNAYAKELYDYVVMYPGMLLPYGVGLARFGTMRSIAEEQLGSDFNLKEFHTAMLKDGDRPFENVMADLRDYLGGNAVEETATSEPEIHDLPVPGLENNQLVFQQSPERNEESLKLALAGMGIFAAAAAVLVILRNRRKNHDPFA